VTVADDFDFERDFDALPVDPPPPPSDAETLEERTRRMAEEGRRWRDMVREGEDDTNAAFVELPRPEELLAVRWVDTYDIDPPPAEDPVVEGLLNVGEFMVVGAERGIGKTWLGYNLASVLTTGGHLFDRLEVPQPRKVLYLQGELDETQAAVRWRMLHHDSLGGTNLPHVAETFDPVRFRVVRRRQAVRGEGETTTDEYLDAVVDHELEATIVALGIEVVVVDPWAVFFSGNESSNDEVEAVLGRLREITLRHRVTWVLLHHFGKARDFAEPEDMWRGASRLADWAANRVTITRHYTDKKAKELGLERREARRYADLHFLRRGAPIDDFSVHLGPDGWWRQWEDEDDDDDEAHGTYEQRLLEALHVHGVFRSSKDAGEKTGISENTAKKHLEILLRQGRVSREIGKSNAHVWRPVEPVDNEP